VTVSPKRNASGPSSRHPNEHRFGDSTKRLGRPKIRSRIASTSTVFPKPTTDSDQFPELVASVSRRTDWTTKVNCCPR
jgi:hypothetical protein